MSGTRRMLVAAAATVLLVAPLATTASVAAWTDEEHVHGTVGTSSFDCDGAPPTSGFTTVASGRFLSGSLLGTDLDPIADLERMRLTQDGPTASPSPSDAQNLNAPPPRSAYANPFEVGALGVVGADLTGLAVPLPGAQLGAANQYASVSPLGDAAGASGLVNDSGAVLVSQDTPSADLPEPATISLSGLLPATAGITGAELQVGAVGASSILDGCEALRSSIWGDGSVTGSVRDYGIAGLGLQIDSPLVSGLNASAAEVVAVADSGVAALLGPDGVIADAIVARVQSAVPALAAARATGDVTISGLDIAGAVAPLLGLRLSDGVVSVDLSTGSVEVDIDALLPSLNDAAPNTEIVINSSVLAPVLSRATALLSAWRADVLDAVEQAILQAQVQIGLTVNVSLVGTGIAAVTVGATASIASLMASTASIAVSAAELGLAVILNPVLSAVQLNLNGVLSTLRGLSGALGTSIDVALTAEVDRILADAELLLFDATGDVTTALGSVVAALPSVVSLMVNVQPDQPGVPAGAPSFVPATDDATAEFVVSALRIGLADAVTGGPAVHVLLGTASAGPVVAP